MIRIIGFDLDDTLIPEVLFLKSGIQYIAEWLANRYHVLPKQRIIGCMETAVLTRQNHYSALERLLDELRLAETIDIKDAVAALRGHIPDPAIYHPAPSMLSILKDLRQDRDARTVLITDGRSLTQRNKIEAAGLKEFFDESDIYISEEIGHDKNHPDTFLHIMEKYAGAEEFHYVGDNPLKDFLHPSRLGWTTHLVHRFPLMIHQGMPR